MREQIEEFVLETIQKKYPIGPDVDRETLNYVENGYIDSLGLVQFVMEIELEFGIEFSDEELEDPDFKIVGKLVDMIRRKVEAME